MRSLLPVLALFALAALTACEASTYVPPVTPENPPSPDSGATDTQSREKVLVTTTKEVSRQADVLEVFDLHTPADTQDKGFEELRKRARALGADAVIGAEFEHGDGSEPSHLSGMAIRYTEPLPPYDPIGPVEVDTPEDSPDKGLNELVKKGHALGGDTVVGVSFEHGEGKEPSRLTGTAIRWRR